MPTSPVSGIIQHLTADARPDGAGLTDGELLARVLGSRDADALAALVWRHAPMVWGVCRRLLPNPDAEDAFQATFLVLVRRAADVPGSAVAGWLYGVARRTAVRLRATAAKRGRREAQVATMPEPTATAGPDPDLRAVLDEELSRLPDHYRGVIVLCDLEGRTRKEAARHLGIPEGSAASRLVRARALLAKRLTRRGFGVAGGAMVSGVAATSAPAALVADTIRAVSLPAAEQAAGGPSAGVAALTEGVVRAMVASKVKSALAVVLVAGLALGGIGLGVGASPTAVAARPPVPAAVKPLPPKLTAVAVAPAPKPLTKEERLQAVIRAALAAHGGDKLKKLTSFTMTVRHSNGETQHYCVRPPKDFRWETTHRDRAGKRIVILSPEGRRWWNQQPGEAAKEFIPTGAEPRMEFWLDYVKFFGPRQVLRLTDADHKVALLDEEAKVGDRAAVGVQVTGPQCKQKLYFDRETFLLLRGVGSDILREVTFSHYKTFDGIPIARKEHDGHFDPEVTDFRVVDRFDDGVFERP